MKLWKKNVAKILHMYTLCILCLLLIIMYVRIIKFVTVKNIIDTRLSYFLFHRCKYPAYCFVSHIPVYWLVVWKAALAFT